MIEQRLRKSENDSEGDGEVISLDGRTILMRHRDGDKSAFEELMKLYRAPVYSYLVRLGVAAEARDDLFQEIFLKIHHARDSYQAERPLTPWVFTIVVNTVRSSYRKQQIQKFLSENNSGENTSSDTFQVESIVEAKQTLDWLEFEIQKLPVPQREAIILCCIENMETQDAANVLEIPLGTLKTNLHRARIALAKALARRNAKIFRETEATAERSDSARAPNQPVKMGPEL